MNHSFQPRAEFGEDSLLEISNATYRPGSDVYRFGNNYDSILEITTHPATGEISGIWCMDDPSRLEMDTEPRDPATLEQRDGLPYYFPPEEDVDASSYPPFQITFTRNRAVILFSSKIDAETHCYSLGRITYYYGSIPSDNDFGELLYIRIDNLTEEEYSRLRRN